MPDTIASFVTQLQRDPWRDQVGFAAPFAEANLALTRSQSEAVAVQILGAWLQKHQPCLFGRIAAKLGFLSYCILLPEDLRGSDQQIRNKIQTARSEWTRQA